MATKRRRGPASGGEPVVTEPMIVIDSFVTGMLAENHGGHRRLVFYCDRPTADGNAVERIVVVRAVCTEAGFEAIRASICQADGDGKAH